MFRLALSIATTRLILLEQDAGHIVEAFGNFVVGGNLAVGMVIFLILTLVNFLVITKGSGGWPKWPRVSAWTRCPASRCPSTATCVPA